VPRRAKRPCTYPRCAALVDSGRCSKHKHVEAVEHDHRRGNAASRGYDRRWAKYRALYLTRNPWCVMCKQDGLIRAANTVDHIVPISGPSDPLFWPETNHQSLCTSHHSYKTRVVDQRGYGARKNNASNTRKKSTTSHA
jgi:5-methylcytosine-specific restriction protein A